MVCDLHTHSCASDGTDAPEKIIELSVNLGLSAVALCDHNTLAGLPSFMKAAEGTTVEAVPGVEITCGYGGKEVHMLGLFLKDFESKRLNACLEEINRRKIEGNRLLLDNLNRAGYKLTLEEVLEFTAEAIPNRAHFAKALVKRGMLKAVTKPLKLCFMMVWGFMSNRKSLTL